jgi:virginiamycin B lyase
MLVNRLIGNLLLSLFALATYAYAIEPVTAKDIPSVQEIALDQPTSGPAIVAVDADDTVWVALARSGKLAKYINGEVKTYALGADARPVGIAVGTPQNEFPGDIWIAASYDNKILRFHTATGKVDQFPIDGNDSWPFNIAIGPDQTVWFTERAAGRVGMLDASTGKLHHYSLPTANCGPAGLAVDLATKRVWFSESYADRIGELDIATGKITEFKMSDQSTGLTSGPAGVALDAAGRVWFGKLEGKIGMLDPATGAITLRDVPDPAGRPAGVTVAENGDVWMVSLDGNAVLRYIPTTEQFLRVPLPSGSPDTKPSTPPFARSSRPFGIAMDHKGNVWISEQYTGNLGVIRSGSSTAEIFSPHGVVRFPDPLFTYQYSGVSMQAQHANIFIDGQPVRVQNGRLDLRGIRPGTHVASVTLSEDGLAPTHAESTFNFQPTKQALVQMFKGLQPTTDIGKKAQLQLLSEATALLKDSSDDRIQQLHNDLLSSASAVGITATGEWLAAVDLQHPHPEVDASMSILDSAPYFSPVTILLKQGGTIIWRYDPPSDGHSISHEQHVLEIKDRGVTSTTLHAGETFVLAFPSAGKFIVQDKHDEMAQAVIEVIP